MTTPTGVGAARNRLIDVARAVSVLVVVLFHMALFQVRWVDGELQAGVLALGSWAWYVSWLVQVMPMFFLAGGFAHTRVVDRMHREGTGYGHYLARRGTRLLGPLGFFVGVIALITTATAWLFDFDLAVLIGRLLARVLWFMAVYIGIVIVAPLMVRLHDRLGVWVPVALGLLAVGVDLLAVHPGPIGWRWWNLAFVWLACHQLGIGFARGWLRVTPAHRTPVAVPVLAGLAGAVTLVAMLASGIYPPTAVGLGDHPESNLQPPGATMLVLCFVQMCVLALLDRRHWPRLHGPRFTRLLDTINALLVTIYLWHVSAIGLAMVLMLAPAVRRPALAPWLVDSRAFALLAIPLLIFVVPRIARVELRLIPELGPRQSTPLALVAAVILLAGTFAVWRYGTVLHPRAMGSTIGVLLVATGSWVLALAGNRPAVPRRPPV